MDKQIKLYSVDTKAFYTSEEKRYSDLKMFLNRRINNIKKELKKQSVEFVKANKDIFIDLERENQIITLIEDGIIYIPYEYEESHRELIDSFINIDEKSVLEYAEKVVYDKLISRHKKYKKTVEIKKIVEEKFNEEINKFKGVRKLNRKSLTKTNLISLFESSLTRTMNFKVDEITNDIIIIRPYHYVIFNQLVKNGYDLNVGLDENNKIKKAHFRILTASAGQIRTKKCVFINEELWKQKEKTLLCGLTIEDMNNSSEHGMNLTKFMAYLALNNSATDEITDFDIDRCIVVEDFETNVKGLVDYIDVNKLKDNDIEDCIERKIMEVPITHSDGAGLMLPKVNTRNFMIRLPWVKGLLTPCHFINFCKTERKRLNDNNKWVDDLNNFKVADIYGIEHDLQEEDIQIIFTKSQFKAYKYYTNDLDSKGNIVRSGWDKYKQWFKEYDCKANMCNLEPTRKEFRKASLNYQMLQSSTDVTDEEIKYFTKPVCEYIYNGYTDIKTQLDMLKATKENKYRNNLQTALMIYPEMIQESYCKSLLSDMLNKKKKQAKFAKFKVDGTYTFLIPDIYAWMENLFNGNKNPKGILTHTKTVSCKLYKNVNHVVVNRSPHLYRELGIEINVVNKKTNKWFTTDGCYTSCHDLISKLLQFDNDGDKTLIIGDQVYYEMAKRNMKGIVPLYYEMAKASPQIINNENLYNALVDGYKYGNVGQYSNKITVLWNKEKVDIGAIKILTCLNNFYIDGAKTGYMPEVSDEITKRLKEANGKLPYFFMFAKDKEQGQVDKRNNSTVNRICREIENIGQGKYNFSTHGTFRYAMLLRNKNMEINMDLVNYYIELERDKNMIMKNSDLDKTEIHRVLIDLIRDKLVIKSKELGFSQIEMCDIIVKYIYDTHKNNRKSMLWEVLGDLIIDNIRYNLKNTSIENGEFKMCECCGKRFKLKSLNSSQIRCEKCAKIIKNEQNKKYYKNKI